MLDNKSYSGGGAGDLAEGAIPPNLTINNCEERKKIFEFSYSSTTVFRPINVYKYVLLPKRSVLPDRKCLLKAHSSCTQMSFHTCPQLAHHSATLSYPYLHGLTVSVGMCWSMLIKLIRARAK